MALIAEVKKERKVGLLLLQGVPAVNFPDKAAVFLPDFRLRHCHGHTLRRRHHRDAVAPGCFIQLFIIAFLAAADLEKDDGDAPGTGRDPDRIEVGAVALGVDPGDETLLPGGKEAAQEGEDGT